MAVLEQDNQLNIQPKAAPQSPFPPDFPAECKDAAVAAGNDIVKSLNGLSTEKALTQPGAYDQAIIEGAGNAILELGKCMQRAGKLPGGKPGEGRPIS